MYDSHTVYMLIRGVEAGSTFPTIVMLQTMKIYNRGHLSGMICSTVIVSIKSCFDTSRLHTGLFIRAQRCK